MVLPHSPEFGYRRHCYWGAVAFGSLLLIVSPNQPLGLRIAAPGLALLSSAGGLAVGWLPLKLQAVFWAQSYPGAIGRTCLFMFYFFSIGAVANLFVIPLEAGSAGREDALALMGVMIPAGFGAAAGAYAVFRQHVDVA